MTAVRRRRPLLIALGVVALLIGGVWIGQGLGFIPGSFMTGDTKWFVIGAVVALLGLVSLVSGLSGSSRKPVGRP